MDGLILQTIRHRARRFRASANRMINIPAPGDLHLQLGTVHSLNAELTANYDKTCEAFAHITKRFDAFVDVAARFRVIDRS